MGLNTAGPSAPHGVRAGHPLLTAVISLTDHLIPYGKPYLSIPEQIAHLTARGMVITDKDKAAACLKRIGFYRLSGYWHPFKKLAVDHVIIDGVTKRVAARQNEFVEGTEFSDVLRLYVFDKKLRMLALDAIERVEVGLRVDVALLLGQMGTWAHRDPSFLHPSFSRSGKHSTWLNKLDESSEKSGEEFAVHFRRKYSSHLPIWMAIELWDFGQLSHFVAGMRYNDQKVIAQKYGLSGPEMLVSWVRSINHVRNISAHHARLWNRALTNQPKLPQYGAMPLLDHIAIGRQLDNNLSPFRVYSVLSGIQLLLRIINPTTTWATRLTQHVCGFPSLPGVSISQAGFPHNWSALDLWKGPSPTSL
ncbi:Abi family protein [Roseomonas sp. DSM 102946]|nr:Abi family protein [Roseomonas sp. DSM 102946]